MRVPVQEGNLVEQGPGVTERFVAAQGGNIGPGIEALGRGLGDFAEGEARVAEYHSEAGAKDLDNAFTNFANSTLYDGDKAFFTLRGKDALAAAPGIQDSIRGYAETLMQQAKTPLMKQMLGDTLNQRMNAIQREVGAHTAQQTFQYNVDETRGGIDEAARTAGNAYLDPPTAEANIASLRSKVSSLGTLTGLGPEATADAQLKAVSGVRKDIATRLVYAGPQGPSVALAYIDKHKDDFTSDDAEAITTHARTYQNALDAEQRREEAERRRQDSQDRSEAAARAQDVDRILSTGTPLPPQQVANAINDATIAKRPGLVFSLGQASFKNNLNLQYRSATPSEIQNRINELGPKIASAGDKADVQDVVEYNHLTQVKNASEAQLKSDPISWGADHLGIQTPALDWNNPQALNQRMQNAQAIAQRTGTQPKLLTQTEAAPLAAQAASIDPRQRMSLVFQLAQAGPQFGTIAARQVAPGDPGLAALVGLATGPDAGVAHNLVMHALQGPETIKAFPKIISKNFDGTFSSAIANTFRALDPSSVAGIKTISRNLLASNSAAAGVHEGADTDDAVKASINGALGAYNDHGVMRGGLGTHAGQQTILPEGWSQPEFDTAVARATVPQLLSAANGHPVWANGKPLFSGELKNMEMVPVGDGRYRFATGSGFVANKEGGFFELDVRRLSRK